MKKTAIKSKVGKKKILIVDDHPLLRQGLTQLINQETDLKVCGEAKDANEALQKTDALKPDIVILDLTLEGISGLELIKTIRHRFSKVPVLVLSMHEESIYAERALRNGALGYVMKQEASDVVVGAIQRVLKGEIYVSDKMASLLLHKMADGETPRQGSSVERLSNRELEVFTLIGKGFGTRQISEKLCLSIKTIETHREHIKDKLELKNATELVRQAVQWVEGRQT